MVVLFLPTVWVAYHSFGLVRNSYSKGLVPVMTDTDTDLELVVREQARELSKMFSGSSLEKYAEACLEIANDISDNIALSMARLGAIHRVELAVRPLYRDAAPHP